MLKLVTILSIAFILAAAQGSQQDNINAFLDSVRQENAKVVQLFDIQIETYNQNRKGQLDAIATSSQLLASSISAAIENFNTLRTISEASRQCVDKYTAGLPTVRSTNRATNDCVNTLNSDFPNLYYPNKYRNELEAYYETSFEKNVKKCQTNSYNSTNCTLAVVSECNDYIAYKQERFDQSLRQAYCTFESNINDSLSCNFNVENSTVYAISEAGLNINLCVWGESGCKDATTYSCSEVKTLKKSQISNTEKTMPNPYYRKQLNSDCLTLKVTN